MKQPVEQSSGEDRMTEEVAHSAETGQEHGPSRRLFSRWLER